MVTRLPRLLLAPLAAWAALIGCNPDILEQYRVCLVTGDPMPAEAAPGDVVLLRGAPMSEPFDTVVRVGGVVAEVMSVERDGCTACDACRAEEGCSSCGPCPDCDADCGGCEQALSFLVPDIPGGPTVIMVYNQHGTSAPIPFQVWREPDTGLTPDTGADTDEPDTDTDAQDTDETDTDTGSHDTDASDTDTDTVHDDSDPHSP